MSQHRKITNHHRVARIFTVYRLLMGMYFKMHLFYHHFEILSKKKLREIDVSDLFSVDFISLDTPPGVKLLLKPKTKVVNGFYILNDQTCEVLGGTVTELVQKWKLAKVRMFVLKLYLKTTSQFS